ncbi:hypothetical protein Ate01nite_30680 [Actinoplanes teichomyceticus]|nr:hypothetical protein Ate01nite_30680 [Actinoplanes teichomyceticus]
MVNADPADVRRITDTKITFEVPSSAYPATDSSGNASTVNPNGLVLGSGQTTARWSVCVYDSASTTAGTLLATASYTLVQRPTITAVTPAAGPAGGGTTITVTGTGFTAVTTPITAEIGGAELTNIRVAANGNSFTATTGPHGAGSGLELSVDTPGGRVGSLDPDNDSATNDAPITFTYSNGITIAPSTAAAGAVVTLDITGAGFADLLFDAAGGTPTSSRAHVFLVDGAYDPATNRGVAECTGVMVVADTELVCTLDLSTSRLDPATSQPVPGAAIVDGAYIVTVVATGDPGAAGAAHPTIISSGSVFVVAPY